MQLGHDRMLAVIDAIRHYLMTHPNNNLIQQFDESYNQNQQEFDRYVVNGMCHCNWAPEIVFEHQSENPSGIYYAHLLRKTCTDVLEPFGDAGWLHPIIELIAGQRHPEEVKQMIIQIK